MKALLLTALALGQTWYDDVGLYWGTSDDNVCEYDTAVTPDALVCGLGTDSRIWYIAETADVGTDWAKAQQTNPTLCIQSADEASTTDRICLTHDQTDAVISSDAGGIKLSAASGGIILPSGSDLHLEDDTGLYMGTSDDTVCMYDTAQTPDSLVCGVSTDSERLIVTTAALVGTDLSHADAGRPTLSITDNTGADVVDISHDGTDGHVATNTGDLRLDPAGDGVNLYDDVGLYLGDSQDAVIMWDTAQTNDMLMIGVGNTSRRLIVTTEALVGTNLGLSNASDPVLVLTSDTGNHGLYFVHDDTNGYLWSSTGKFSILDADLLDVDDVEINAGKTIKWDAAMSLASTGNGRLKFSNSTGTRAAVFDVNVTNNTVTLYRSDGVTYGSFQMRSFAMELGSGAGSGWTNGTVFLENGDGTIIFTNWAANDWGMMHFGGTTSSFPALKRSTTKLQMRLGDDSGYAGFDTGDLTVNGDVNLENGEQIINTTDGQVSLEGSGGSNDENLIFDLETTANSIDISSSTGVTQVDFGSLEMVGKFGTQVAAAPSAPVTCNSGNLGYREVVNDSDDGAGTQVCYCGMTDDTTYDWLNIADNTACTHY